MGAKISYIREQVVLPGTPATPDSGYVKLYQKADLYWYDLDSAGVERCLTKTVGVTNESQVGDFTAGTNDIVFVDPVAVLNTLSLTLPTSPLDLTTFRFHFGGTLTDVVTHNITISSTHSVYGTVPLKLWAGDYFKATFHNNNWYIS